ncbi:unnamed protein product [Phyllotreta striolata]|uniref:Uncharacterized protein n=1 Tax=Phyllotreta striolata TaxID=444603 RepID=A0A9N9TQA1_PHYSR|nr:unnamed protein product [Phyllotreta striolata]
MDTETIQAYIYLYLMSLRDNPFTPFDSISVNVSELLNDDTIKGSIRLDNIMVNGLDTLIFNDLEDSNKNINVTQPDPNVEIVDVRLDVAAEKISVTLEYEIDVDWMGYIPIYGKGTFELPASNLHIAFTSKGDKSRVYDLKLNLEYNYETVSLTGFYKNPEASGIAAKVLNIFNILLTMWNSYEPEKASCILSPIFEYAVNDYVMKSPDNKFVFDPTCLKGSTMEIISDLIQVLSKDVDSLQLPCK